VIQPIVAQLLDLTPQLTDDLDQERLEAATHLMDELRHPLSADDIEALIGLLPENGDTACGLSWTVVHAIEASPEWPIRRLIQDSGHEWLRIFRLRLENAGEMP
jgi:hypothetical protein